MQQIALSEGTAARRRIALTIVNDSDGFPLAGQTLTAAEIKISKNGAAEASSTGSFAEVTNQGYYYEATAAELNTRGFLRLRCAKAGLRFDGFFVDVQVGVEAQNAEGLFGLADGPEPGLTFKQWSQGVWSATGGKSSGAGTGTENFRNKADNLNRIVATVDGSGNRTAMTYNFTA